MSKETISRITDRVIEEMAEWQNRPLDPVYAAIFIDAVNVKIRDGHVANRPIYVAIGVTLTGGTDILGLWAGTGGEGAKFWMRVLTDLKTGAYRHVLRRLRRAEGPARGGRQRVAPGDRANLYRPFAAQHVPPRLQEGLGRDQAFVNPIYTAPNPAAARAAFEDLAEQWGASYPAIVRLWDNAWEEFIPFLDYDVEIRRVICSTNAIESLNARYRRAVEPGGTSPPSTPR